MTDYTLHGDFDANNDYTTWTYTRPSDHGVFRAVIEMDEWPDAPDYEAGCPIFRISHRGIEDKPEIGEHSWKHDGLTHDIGEVWERMGDLSAVRGGWDTDTIDFLDRYLRIFHGGSANLVRSTVHQSGDDFLVYDTRAMRESWGQTGEMLETSDLDGDEWQAYIDGEVFVIHVEQATSFDSDGEPDAWEPIDHTYCGGFYGEKHAIEAVMETLEWVIGDRAANMLPMGD